MDEVDSFAPGSYELWIGMAWVGTLVSKDENLSLSPILFFYLKHFCIPGIEIGQDARRILL